MMWFKHQTTASRDPVVSDAEDKFGDAGYIIYFKILEIYGAEFNSLDDGILDVSTRFIARSLRKSWSTVERVLNYYQTNGKLSFSCVDNRLRLKVPKFIEMSSNWTRRTKAKPPEVPTEVPHAIEEKRIEKKRKEVKKKLVPEGFLKFWDAYPKKTGKKNALDSWSKLSKNGMPSVENLITALEIQKGSPDWKKEDGQFIPYPATWLNGKRWEDEVKKPISTFMRSY